MKTLRVENLSIAYPDTDKPIIQEVSFTLKHGETMLLAGASGCGKSTLALAIAGLIPSAIEADFSGNVFVNDQSLESAKQSGAIRFGVVFQDPDAQFCMLTVEEELAFSLENIKTKVHEMDEKINKVLSRVGLSDFKYSRIDRLSGGMRQKLAVACALILEPDILILDEPTANLDPASTRDFFHLIQTLHHQDQFACMMIEHKLEHPAQFIDSLMILDQGKIVAWGNPREIFQKHSALLNHLGVWQPFVCELISKLNTQESHFHPFPLTLEEFKTHVQSQPHLKAHIKTILNSLRQQKSTYNTSTSILQLKNVSYRVMHAKKTYTILNNISLDFPQGSFYALVGANGAGKSTLARLLMNLIKPSSGTVFLNGKDISTVSSTTLSSKIGLVFQNPEHQFVSDSVWNEVAFSHRVLGKNEAEVTREVKATLSEFKLVHYAPNNPFSLSQGEKRRLSVACMVNTTQDVLICDELSFGQDVINTYALMNMVLKRQQQGCTIIMITHDMRLVREYATHVAVLDRGEVAFAGECDTFFKQTKQFESWALSTPLSLEVEPIVEEK